MEVNELLHQVSSMQERLAAEDEKLRKMKRSPQRKGGSGKGGEDGDGKGGEDNDDDPYRAASAERGSKRDLLRRRSFTGGRGAAGPGLKRRSSRRSLGGRRPSAAMIAAATVTAQDDAF